MFFGQFLLFSILLYNTEARTFHENGPAAGTYPDISIVNSTIPPVKNTDTLTNIIETYDRSGSLTNETRYYEPATGDDKTNQSVASENKTLTTDYDYWSVYTPAEVFIATDNETVTTTSTRRPYYSYWGNGLENSTNTSTLTKDSETPYYSYWGNGLESNTNTLTEDSETTNSTTRTPYYSYWGNDLENSSNKTAPTEDSETTSTRRSYYSYWGNESESEITSSKSYYNCYNRTTTDPVKQPANVTEIAKDDDAEYGYLTLENGILTAHIPETKINNTANFFVEAIEKNTTARTPYNPYWDSRDSETTTTTRRPYYRPYWTTKREYETTTTTRRPHYRPYWTTEREYETTTTTRRPHYRPYWTTERGYQTTTTTRRPHYRPYWTAERGYQTTTTTRRPHYRPYWTTERDSETTTTTRRPYYRPYWTTERDSETTTTTRRPYTVTVPNYWKNWTSLYGGDTEYNETTTNFYDTTETTSTTARIIIDPIWPTYSRSPVEVTTNSSVNTNEARDYGALADFLKKLAGTVLPNTGNKVPKSNITNIAIANENGNMFFYMNNYF